MKILCFGSLNLDLVYTLDSFVKAGETISSKSLQRFCGGKGLNQSIALAKAGAEVYHGGIIGNDGEILRKCLEENGVNCSYLGKADCENGHAVIQVDKNGQNCIIIHSGSNGKISAEYVDYVLSHFSAGDFLLLQNEINMTDYIVERAYQIGMVIALNPSPMNEKIYTIDFNKISYLILNEIEGSALAYGEKDCDEIISKINKRYPLLHIMLTLGDKGSIYYDLNRKYVQNAFPNTVVDTTAAGDTFTGYFLSGIMKNEAISRVLEIASKAASISVGIKGAANSIPFYEDVLRTPTDS